MLNLSGSHFMSKPDSSDRINNFVFLLSALLAVVMLLLTIGFPEGSSSFYSRYQCQEFLCNATSCERLFTFRSPIDETNEFPVKNGRTRTVVCEQAG